MPPLKVYVHHNLLTFTLLSLVLQERLLLKVCLHFSYNIDYISWTKILIRNYENNKARRVIFYERLDRIYKILLIYFFPHIFHNILDSLSLNSKDSSSYSLFIFSLAICTEQARKLFIRNCLRTHPKHDQITHIWSLENCELAAEMSSGVSLVCLVSLPLEDDASCLMMGGTR